MSERDIKYRFGLIYYNSIHPANEMKWNDIIQILFKIYNLLR